MTHDIRVLALDIDGVLTDGGATMTEGGEEKRFHFHDLDAVTKARRSGLIVAFVTGEDNEIVDRLARRFGVDAQHIRRGAKDKGGALEELSRTLDVPVSAFCYMGDSDRDAPALKMAGLGLAPADSTPGACAAADRVLTKNGGEGVVWEALCLIETLRANAEADFGGEMARIIEDSIAAHEKLRAESLPVLSQVAREFVNAIAAGRKILLCGNGGSAADAQHVAGELVGRFLRESQPWPAISLAADSSILTCVGNDWDFSDVFARQVRALARPGDLVVGISTSGQSPNVRRALEDARKIGAVTIGFSGAKGESLRELCDVCFLAPSSVTPRIQELHLLAWHAICELVEERLMGGAAS